MGKFDSLLDRFKFDDKGLVTAVAQDYQSGQVLMLAHMNREALETTLERGVACYWSRSRQKLWIKGESSGHLQQVREILVDCDLDALVLRIDQVGGACHTGHRSCFFSRLERDGSLSEIGEKVFDQEAVYGKPGK